MSGAGTDPEGPRLRVIAAWNVLSAATNAWLVRGGCSGARPGDGIWDLHLYHDSSDAVPAVMTVPGFWNATSRIPFKRMHLVYADRESFEARFESDGSPVGLHIAGKAGDEAIRLLLVGSEHVEAVPSVRIEVGAGARLDTVAGTYADALLSSDGPPRHRDQVAPLSGSLVFAEAVATLG